MKILPFRRKNRGAFARERDACYQDMQHAWCLLPQKHRPEVIVHAHAKLFKDTVNAALMFGYLTEADRDEIVRQISLLMTQEAG